MNPTKAATYNLNINQGKLYDKTFTLTKDGTPVDLTGYSAGLRAWDESNSVVFSLSTTLDPQGNGIIIGGAAGTVRVLIKTAKTATLPVTQLRYDLQLTRPDSEDIPFLAGAVYIAPETGDV